MIIGPPLERLFHVLRHGNIPRSLNAARGPRCLVFAACVLVAGLVAVPAHASDPPSEAVVRPAFAKARLWVDAFDVPQVGTPEAEVALDGAAGVCVMLRRSGRVVGIGADWTGDNYMLRRAVGRALDQLLSEPVVHDMPDAMRSSVGPLVSLELEVAGAPEPIIARSFEEAGRQLDPGIDGIAMRREQKWQMIFPAQLRANNTAGEAQRQFLALAADLDLPVTALSELSAKYGAQAYSLRAITLVQTLPTAQPFVAVRGEAVVPTALVTPAALRAWAAQSATHLLIHLALAKPTFDAKLAEKPGEPAVEPPPVGLSGTYNPLADTFDPLVAPPIEQALGAYALDFFARSPGVDPALRAQCADAVLTILHDLNETTGDETNPLESAAACAIIVATIHPDHLAAQPDLRALRDGAVKRLNQAFITTRTFDNSLFNPNDRALVAWGVTRLCLSEPGTYPREIAESAIDQAWKSAPANQRIALLPWIGWAEAELADNAGAPMGNASELSELLAGTCASRISADDKKVAADLAGGLPLMSGGRSRATAQSLRPLSWLASAVRDSRLVPADTRAERARNLREMMRFVRQLMVRDDTTWRYRNNEHALGGIREATWDLSQPVPAQALGLLTLLEAAETLQTVVPEQPAGH